MRIFLSIVIMLAAAGPLRAQLAGNASSDPLRTKAYELYTAGQLEAALASFQAYLDKNAGDATARFDRAAILAQLNRHQEAAQQFEILHQTHPRHEAGYFRLGLEYVALQRLSDARNVFNGLRGSANPEMVAAATAALGRIESDQTLAAKRRAEARVFELARESKHAEVIAAVDDLERQGEVSYALQLQRLHSMNALHQSQPALERADKLAQRYPASPELALLRAELLVQLGRRPEAEALWERVARENPGTPAASEATRRRETQALPAAEEHVYELARMSKHAEVIAAVDQLEQKGSVTLALQLQRLYSMSALGQHQAALERADKLAEQYPKDTDLALMRADLLVQLGRGAEAQAIWASLVQQNPNTQAAAEAARRAREQSLRASEERIFALVRQDRHDEAVSWIDTLEREGRLTWVLGMQRIYSLSKRGDSARALAEAERLQADYPDSADLALARAGLLAEAQRPAEAARVFKKVKEDHPYTHAAEVAGERLHNLPASVDPDKHFWGEAYAAGDYLGRYGTLLGSGFIRQGAFIPEARWLQPYAEFRFAVDTHSGSDRETIIADNAVGFYGGMRAQLFPTEYLFIYGQGGVNKDLLDNRENGDWALDYQAGIYGFKAWGPGMVIGPSVVTVGGRAVGASTPREEDKEKATRAGIFWRGDWFTDVGADFSYYHRYRKWLGYGQTRQGFRLFQIGPNLAFDAYAVENVGWDISGNFFDNYFDLGPGARLVWVPRRAWEVVLRAEWSKGWYFGRDDLGNRGNTPGDYDGVHVGLSVGVRW